MLVRLDEPTPGIALMGVHTWDGKVHASMSLYLFGDRAEATLARDKPRWDAWMNEQVRASPVAS